MQKQTQRASDPAARKQARRAPERGASRAPETSASASATLCPKLSLSKLSLCIALPESLNDTVSKRHGHVLADDIEVGGYVQLFQEGFAHFVHNSVAAGEFQAHDQPYAGAMEIHGLTLQLPFSCSPVVAQMIRSHTDHSRCLQLHHFAVDTNYLFPAMLSAAEPTEVLVHIQGLPYGLSNADLVAAMGHANLPVVGEVYRPPVIACTSHAPAWFKCATIANANCASVPVRSSTRRFAKRELILSTPHGPHPIRLSVLERPTQAVRELNMDDVRRLHNGLTESEQVAYASCASASARSALAAAAAAPLAGARFSPVPMRAMPAAPAAAAPASSNAPADNAPAAIAPVGATPAGSAPAGSAPAQQRSSKREAAAVAAAATGEPPARSTRRAVGPADGMEAALPATALPAAGPPCAPPSQLRQPGAVAARRLSQRSLGETAASCEATALKADDSLRFVLKCVDPELQAATEPQVTALTTAAPRPARYVHMVKLLEEVAVLTDSVHPQPHTHALRPRLCALLHNNLTAPAASLADLMERMIDGLNSLKLLAQAPVPVSDVSLHVDPVLKATPPAPMDTEHVLAPQHAPGPDSQDEVARIARLTATLESPGDDDYAAGVSNDETSSTSSDSESDTPPTAAAPAAGEHPSEGARASTPNADGA